MKNLKKLIALALCLMMLAALAACGNDTNGGNENPGNNIENNENNGNNESNGNNENNNTENNGGEESNPPADNTPDGDVPAAPAEGAPADAQDLLNKVWDTYAEDEKFAAAGGDAEHGVDGAPGSFDISNPENVEYMLTLPQDSVALIDGAASLMHMMNANTFTCGAFHPVKAEDTATLAQTLHDAIQGKRWMCGFPDKLVIATVDGYVVSLYGNLELVDSFRDKLSTVWANTEIVFDEAIQ